jgi:acyl-CoA oxidase
LRSRESHPRLEAVSSLTVCPQFDKVEIPHINFLSRYAKVDPSSGVYAKPPNAKLSYGTMTYIRANIVQQARMVLARSATVAVRYCAVRRQFADRDAPVTDEGNQPAETAVLNYQMVQARIFPPLVQSFACHYSMSLLLDLTFTY